jgi:hypothetical protein
MLRQHRRKRGGVSWYDYEGRVTGKELWVKSLLFLSGYWKLLFWTYKDLLRQQARREVDVVI